MKTLVKSGFIFLIINNLLGCDMNGPLVKAMENAYQASNQPHTLANKSVSVMLQNHFKNYRNAEEILAELKNQKFTIIENKKEGWKTWPHGEINPYPEEIKKNLRISQDEINYLAKKKFHWGVFERKTAVIVIETDGANVTAIKASINIETL